MSAWSTGFNLAELAADHLKKTGVTPFSFLPKLNAQTNNFSSNEAFESSVNASSKIHFDEFDEFFGNEELDDDDNMILNAENDSNDDSTGCDAQPSEFGSVICRDFEAKEPSGNEVMVKLALYMPHSSINLFDFSTPSPDDIIIAKQKEAS